MARDSSDASLPPLLWAFARADARGNGSCAGAAGGLRVIIFRTIIYGSAHDRS
ncbi:hypothetical protein [Azospirillum largimobile]